MPKPTTRFLTTRAAADILGVTAPTVIKWVDVGRLAAHLTPGGHRRIAEDEVQRFALAQRVESVDTVDTKPIEDDVTRVLVIDREPDFSEMVAEYLQLNGQFRVGYACSAIEAGFQAGRMKPDAILYDIDAVGIDIHAIRRLVPEARILLVTSIWKPEIDLVSSELGAVDVVEKPIKLDQLLEVIQPE